MKCTILLFLSLFYSLHAAQIEPNDTPETANTIIPGQPLSGQLSSPTDQDWMVFSVANRGMAIVYFDAPFTNFIANYFTIQIRDSTGFIHASVDTGENTTFQTNLPEEGLYYIVVLDGPATTSFTGQYSVTLTTGPFQSHVEMEPNNNSSDANLMPISIKLSGQLKSINDQDWYAFQMPTSGTVNVAFDAPQTSFISNHFTIQLTNAYGTIFSSFDTGQNINFQTGLPSAGTYYIVIKDGPSSSFFSKEYGVKVSLSTSNPSIIFSAEIYSAVEIVWPSKIGKSYLVERSDDISTWFPVSPIITGSGSELRYFESIKDRSKVFYRIKEY